MNFEPKKALKLQIAKTSPKKEKEFEDICLLPEEEKGKSTVKQFTSFLEKENIFLKKRTPEKKPSLNRKKECFSAYFRPRTHLHVSKIQNPKKEEKHKTRKSLITLRKLVKQFKSDFDKQLDSLLANSKSIEISQFFDQMTMEEGGFLK